MFIIPFQSADATLPAAGGKGANLARLARSGFPVPDGFIVSTLAYQGFVEAGDLGPFIQSKLAGLSAGDADSLESASADIRAAFGVRPIPDDTRAAILAAHRQLMSAEGNAPVAVRSSATAEDLPDLSFAGQQDTYLNILGEEALLRSVVDCWSSLWTARAIGYRLRNTISQSETALAVVVQRMVPSDVSGVLFTANPLTGLLSECAVDAVFGLGEALVSGQVEPDHYVLDAASGAVLSQTLGSKRVATRAQSGGGVAQVSEEAGASQTLDAGQLRALAALARRVQDTFGTPQDLEWAFANGALYLLQSRPITSLFPVPEVSFDPLRVWFSFGAVQGLVGPLTPLGRDAIRHLAAGAGAMFGLRLKPDEVKVFGQAGERIWIDLTDVIHHPLGYRVASMFLEFIEPSVGRILQGLAADPRLGAGRGRLRPRTVGRLAHVVPLVLFRLARNMIFPNAARQRFDAAIDSYLASARIQPAVDRFGRLANAAEFVRSQVSRAFAFLMPHFIPMFGPGMAALNVLISLSGGDRPLALAVTRGLPRNVTTEMDLALWGAARALRADPEAAHAFASQDAAVLADLYLAGGLPPAAQSAVAGFMASYGMRGVGEIDLGQPRWREKPEPVMRTLQSYLGIDDAAAPDRVFELGRQAAGSAIETLAARARRQPLGRLKEHMARAAANRVRLLMGARESPKFMAIRIMGVARQALLEAGREYASTGVLQQADDVFFLTLSELEELSKPEAGRRDWGVLVAGRRAAYVREERRRQVPRVLVSDGRAFYEGLGSAAGDGDALSGSPVSPGVAEGRVRVVLDPRATQLHPGEILVCPGTDPAWTPLFMAAGGLITEVGGMMTHGSVVAREYGIPAVVGVDQATRRLKDGQLIRVDGTSGQIVILKD